ncbi:MAG: alpha/beta hydrolase [Variovorax sp.]
MRFAPDTDDAARDAIERVDARAIRHDAVQDGVRVRWRCFGSDTGKLPLVLLHGGHGSWMHWLRNVEVLSADRAVWVPDMPGFGESDTPPKPAAGEAALGPLLAALGGTLDQLVGAGTPIALGGFSFGGLVASTFAVQRGDVDRLMLVGSGGHATRRRLDVDMINWRAVDTREEERAALQHNIGALMLHDKGFDPLAFAIHDASCHGTRFRSKDVSLAGGLQAAIDQLRCPQMLLWGEFDVTADPRPLVAQLTEGHANRKGVLIDGAGHWAQYERADAVNDVMLRFLSGL